MVDIILYETYALRRESAFARTKDTELALTITLAVGKGTLVSVNAVEPGTSTVITKRAPGSLFDLLIKLKNDGETDYIWHTAKDKDTGTIIVTQDGISINTEEPLNAGYTSEHRWRNIAMPNKNFNILVEAGHGRA